MTLRKTLLTLTVIGSMLSLAGCGGEDKASTSGATSASKTASTTHLNIGNGTEPESLDPQKASDSSSFTIIRQMFAGLVTSDATGKTIPAFAESWEHQDETVWTFKLRQGLTWSNGEPLTAHDFVYAMRRLTDPATGSHYGNYLADAKVANAKEIGAGKAKVETLGVKAIDEHTLQITLTDPVPYLPDLLTLPVTYAVPQKAIEAHGDKWLDPANIVVSGAYKLTDWQVNSHIKLERNKAYIDDAKTKIDTVSFLPVQGASEINRYKAGELDITTGIPPEQFQKIKQEHGSEVHTDPKLCTFYLEYNVNSAPFNDPKVRQALAMVVDRDIITGQILGRGEISSYQFAPATINGMTEIKPEWASLDKAGRAESAKKLLAEAGYSTTNPVKFEILYSTSETGKRLTTASASMMKEQLGGMAEVSIINQEWKTSLDTRRQGKFQSALAGWCADYNEPSSFYNMFRAGNGNNTGKYNNPEFDKLLDQTMQKGLSLDARNKLYHEAERLLQKDNPAIFIYVPTYNKLVKSNIKAESLADPLSNWQVKDWSIE